SGQERRAGQVAVDGAERAAVVDRRLVVGGDRVLEAVAVGAVLVLGRVPDDVDLLLEDALIVERRSRGHDRPDAHLAQLPRGAVVLLEGLRGGGLAPDWERVARSGRARHVRDRDDDARRILRRIELRRRVPRAAGRTRRPRRTLVSLVALAAE